MKTIAKILLTVLIVLRLIIALSSCGPRDLEICIFSDMSECRAIESEQLGDVQVILYDSPTKDKYIEDLVYTDYYACNYSSSNLQFDLFAYEFSNEATAQAYFKNATGQNAARTVTFSDSSGLTKYQRIVISENLAYSVYTDASDAAAVTEIINQFFSEKVVSVDW